MNQNRGGKLGFAIPYIIEILLISNISVLQDPFAHILDPRMPLIH